MIEISIEQLESLLSEQKRLVVEKLLQHTYIYNSESTNSQLKPLPIDEAKFKEYAMGTEFPNDVKTLKKYGIK